MLFNLVDILQKRQRLLYVALFIAIDIFLLSFCSQALHAHRTGVSTRIHNAEISAAQPQYDGDISDDIERVRGSIEAGALRTAVMVADHTIRAEQASQRAASTALHAAGSAAVATMHGIGRAATITGRVIAFPFVALGNGIEYVFGGASGLAQSKLASVIQPEGGIENVPTITPEQAQQVTLIQKDTLAVTPSKPTGSGGACDNGAGNGGYPMEWCDTRMDTIQTVSYSSDRINRQCTSYAYWYFTTIEGYSDFHVTGDAKHWARTSNYPTHANPAVGAIAVQTTGVYGHVAIVQALPGQVHDGTVVPEGYILVSEMNYDWQGHFRYSYSPMGKFSAYIYP